MRFSVHTATRCGRSECREAGQASDRHRRSPSLFRRQPHHRQRQPRSAAESARGRARLRPAGHSRNTTARCSAGLRPSASQGTGENVGRISLQTIWYAFIPIWRFLFYGYRPRDPGQKYTHTSAAMMTAAPSGTTTGIAIKNAADSRAKSNGQQDARHQKSRLSKPSGAGSERSPCGFGTLAHHVL